MSQTISLLNSTVLKVLSSSLCQENNFQIPERWSLWWDRGWPSRTVEAVARPWHVCYLCHSDLLPGRPSYYTHFSQLPNPIFKRQCQGMRRNMRTLQVRMALPQETRIFGFAEAFELWLLELSSVASMNLYAPLPAWRVRVPICVYLHTKDL